MVLCKLPASPPTIRKVEVMYEIICFHCGHIAHISPDTERCAVCGADLKHLITPDYASRYFYDRAAEMAAAGEVTLALLEAERGLAYRRTPELHLLAAILSQRLGKMEQVRQHVAAIPVDDSLRPEAEWLLRSQQTTIPLRQPPGRRTALDRPLAKPMPPAENPTAVWRVDEPAIPAGPLTWRFSKFGYGSLALLLVALIGWVGFGSGAQVLRQLFPATAPAASQPAIAPTDSAVINTRATPLTNTLVITPGLPTITPDVPPNLVLATPEPVAATTSQQGLNVLNQQVYDLKSYLLQTNRPELGGLEVSATLQGVTLTLSGIVSLFDERQALIELAQRAPAVGKVNAVDLLVRLPPTYTVQTGDTLWFISYKLYGDNRVDQLYNANRDILSSPEAVDVGQVLKVPNQ